MKRLIWKELTELKWTPVIMGALLASVVVLLILLYGQQTASNNVEMKDFLRDAPLLIAGLFLATGIVTGASAIASETGNGTIKFLSSLPLSRTDIWLSKLIAAFVTITASVFITCGLVLGACAFLSRGWRDALAHSSLLFDSCYPEWWIGLSVLALFGLSVSMVASTLVDRAITALILAGVVTLAILSVVATMVNDLFGDAGDFGAKVLTILTLLSATFLLASLAAFNSNHFCGIRQPGVLVLTISLGSILVLSSAIALYAFAVPASRWDAVWVCNYISGPDGISKDSTITCGPTRTLLGQVYTGRIGLANRSGTPEIPFRTVDLGKDVHSQIGVVSDIVEIAPVLDIIYTPSGLPGSDKQEIIVLNRAGDPIADVIVKSKKIAER